MDRKSSEVCRWDGAWRSEASIRKWTCHIGCETGLLFLQIAMRTVQLSSQHQVRPVAPPLRNTVERTCWGGRGEEKEGSGGIEVKRWARRHKRQDKMPYQGESGSVDCGLNTSSRTACMVPVRRQPGQQAACSPCLSESATKPVFEIHRWLSELQPWAIGAANMHAGRLVPLSATLQKPSFFLFLHPSLEALQAPP